MSSLQVLALLIRNTLWSNHLDTGVHICQTGISDAVPFPLTVGAY